MNVSIIGSGNVAWHLAPALDNAGYPVREVFSRDLKHARALVDHLYEAEARTSLDFSESGSKIFIIAVPDDAIEEVVCEVVLPEDAILVHTSGSQSLEVLSYAAAENTGVFYPLQTFTKSRKVDLREVPFFIESADPTTEKVLVAMAGAISSSVHRINSAQRQALHVAAVFASNFTNHMLAISHDVMSENDLDFAWLKPLVAETINKALTLGPGAAQTGPARRGDLETLDKHMEFLQHDEAMAAIYKTVSQHILDRYTG